MTSPAQVANDLMAQADRLAGRGQDDLVKSLRRGARVIRELIDQTDQSYLREPRMHGGSYRPVASAPTTPPPPKPKG